MEEKIKSIVGKYDIPDNIKYFLANDLIDLFNETNSNPVQAEVMPLATEIREHLFQQLMAQISVYSGKRDGGLATLQDLFYKLDKGEKIICDCCGHEVNGRDRHQAECEIVKHYFKYLKDESSQSA